MPPITPRLSNLHFSSVQFASHPIRSISRTHISARHSSGSPTKTHILDDHFTKTGERPQDTRDTNIRSSEYSQSGGDDMVAQQGGASFDVGSSPSITTRVV